MLEGWIGHATLFLSALSAATILPGSSEVVLFAMVRNAPEATPGLLLTATAGNTLGSAVNWCLGRWLTRFAGRRWFPVSAESLEKAGGWFRRYGTASLLFSWVPIVGDPLTAAAGMLRTPFIRFVVLVAIGKAARYAVVIAGAGAL